MLHGGLARLLVPGRFFVILPLLTPVGAPQMGPAVVPSPGADTSYGSEGSEI
jgi:hypothetical protein